MSIIRSSLLLGAGDAAAGGLQVSRSLRFNGSVDSSYLSRTPASAGNRKTWTWSGWVKRSGLSTQEIFAGGAGGGDTTQFEIGFESNSRFFCWGAVTEFINTAQVFRDVGAWYHILVALDTTQATASNRLKVYINGVEVTAFSSDSRSSLTLNGDFGINQAALHTIGRRASAASWYLDGYLANIHFIDGQALTPASFAETDATTGQWMPKAYSGSYGTNGFYLQFADNSSNTASTLGKDYSGLGNNWTPNNFSVATGGPTSVAAASGALPVFNTTDTYGAVKGTGTRTDTNASSLSLCVPMGTATGLSLTDEQPTGRISSSSTLTNTGVTNSTSVSKFYGGSALFSASRLDTTATSDFLFGTGDFTVEGWFYQTANSTYPSILEIGAHLGVTGIIFIPREPSTGRPCIYSGAFYGSGLVQLNTWNHIAWTRASGVLKIFVNGVLSSSDAFTNNLTDTTGDVTIGTRHNGDSQYNYPGYIQDLRVYKGVAKYTGNFNPPTSTVIGSVAAGNDSLIDSPTNGSQSDTGVGGEVRGNYCTMNPIDVFGSATFTDGNLQVIPSAGATNAAYATMPVRSGKWYWEITVSSDTSTGSMIGVTDYSVPPSQRSWYSASGTYGYLYYADGTKYTPGTPYTNSSYGSSFTTGAVIGVALDMDNGTATMYKNGVSQGNIATGLTGKLIGPVLGQGASTGGQPVYVANFGQRAFAYTAPSGYKALCTQNLPAPLVTKSNTVMDVALYTGNGSTQSITGLAFSPDLVWVKMRSGNDRNILSDVVRGITNVLNSDSTRDEATATEGNQITSVTSTGFTVGSNGNVNQSSSTFVGWAWDAGTSTVTNNSGSISSQVRANVSAGFSVITATTTNTSTQTFGHGLNVAPVFHIIKLRNGVDEWYVYHSSVGATKYLKLNSTAAQTTSSAVYNDTAPTSSLITLGSGWNSTSYNIVCYAFAPVVGYSSFGSYVGNGSATDGPFVFTGMRPRWILLKASSTTGAWILHDTARTTYNVMGNELRPDDTTAEYAVDRFDLLSNGFKVRSSNATLNTSSATYIYAAFAEAPFNYSRAR